MKICIDAGHNYSGADTGSEENGLREQDVSFKVAEILKSKLEAAGVTVIMTRNKITDNTGSTLRDSINNRYKIANKNKADYFISLHCDSSTLSSAKGAHICVYDKDSTAARLAGTIIPFLMNLGLEGRDEKVVKRTDLGVLKYTNMPAVLIEMGFITNKENSLIMKNKNKELADAIFKGICSFLGLKKQDVQKLSAETIVQILSSEIEILDKSKAISEIENEENKNSSIYWILNKIANKEFE